MYISQRGPRIGRLAVAAALVVAMGAIGVAAADNAPPQRNLFEQPALQSNLAGRSLMLSVTQAGERLVAVGERGFILISEDHGNSWQQVESPVSVTLTRVRFASPADGWAVGHAGVVLHSSDGGRTWKRQLDGVAAAQLALAAAQAETGEDAEDRLAEAQRLVDDGPDKPFLNLHFFDAQRGLVVGAYGLAFATDDGGKSWKSISARLDNPSALHLYDVLELENALFICGEQGLMLRSTDGGASFQALETPASGTLFGMVAAGSNGLIAFGLRGKAYRTDDLGATWRPLPSHQSATLTAGTRLSSGELILADETGSLQLSRDDGRSFQVLPIPESGFLSGISELPDGQLAVSSTHGVIRIANQDLNRSTGREQ
ncbi:YCF48-related protein [Pseudomonas sp. LFM046]|uniref:WD40/YVTN/BNR-like repeat-containing protein n=1 Tax=Pseudomonas sp. LFM046 TaxID=1608357 RepID=UPI0005CFDD2C|nr:YCF48-related protein [Pseudomonas sp. LFM046]